jgi:hypothetical protein
LVDPRDYRENRWHGDLADESFGLSAIAVGLLLGTGPISIFPALLGVIGGLFRLIRQRAVHAGPGDRGLATTAVVIGSVTGVLSVIIMFSSHAV